MARRGVKKRRDGKGISPRARKAIELTQRRKMTRLLWLIAIAANGLTVALFVLQRSSHHIKLPVGLLLVDIFFVVFAVLMTVTTKKRKL